MLREVREGEHPRDVFAGSIDKELRVDAGRDFYPVMKTSKRKWVEGWVGTVQFLQGSSERRQ